MLQIVSGSGLTLVLNKFSSDSRKQSLPNGAKFPWLGAGGVVVVWQCEKSTLAR